MVTRIHEFMVPNRVSLRGSFPNCFLHYFSRKFTVKFQQYLNGRVRGWNFAAFSNLAIARALDDFPVEEYESDSINMSRAKVPDFLNLMEQRGIQANHQTYLLLLSECLNSRSLTDAKKFHGRILKSGFDADHEVCWRLVDVYATLGDLDDAVQLFDNLSDLRVSNWKILISDFSGKKLTRKVLGLFSRMINENLNPDETTFAHILRACIGDKVAFRYIKQIHAKIIHLGFGASPLVCNPLIDLYTKSGLVDYAKRVFRQLSWADSVSEGFFFFFCGGRTMEKGRRMMALV